MDSTRGLPYFSTFEPDPVSPSRSTCERSSRKDPMRRSRFLFALTALLFVAVTACESSTDLSEVSIEGQWDLVGQGWIAAGQNVRVRIQSGANDTFTGQWWFPGGQQRGITNISQQEDGSVRFTMQAFPGGTALFEGKLQDRYTMRGTLGQIDGVSGFRRTSFSP
jgi:hypothetical protein